MTCFDEGPDWDAGTENAYDEHRNRFSSGLCERCGNDVALPDEPDGWCAGCVLEVEAAIAETEAAA